MSATLPQLSNDAVLDVRPGDQNAATQTARAGLIVAVNRYDPDYGSPFVAYAAACVVGELKRYLRDTSWRLHVPRTFKEQALRLCRASDELHQRLGRSPTTTELAEQLAMSEEEVPEALMAVTSRWEVSLDQPVGADADGCLGDLVAAPAVGEEPEDLLALPGLVASLPEVEREVIVLRFFQDLDQYEIAARGGLLPDARVAPAAPGPGPHACPAGGVLTAKGAMSYRGESLLTGLRTCLLKFA